MDFLLILHDDRAVLLVLEDFHLVFYLEASHFHLLAWRFVTAAYLRLLLLVFTLLLALIRLSLLLCFLLNLLWWLIIVLFLWGADAVLTSWLLFGRNWVEGIEGNLLELYIVLFIIFFHHFLMTLQQVFIESLYFSCIILSFSLFDFLFDLFFLFFFFYFHLF